jgi:hypothetical protein
MSSLMTTRPISSNTSHNGKFITVGDVNDHVDELSRQFRERLRTLLDTICDHVYRPRHFQRHQLDILSTRTEQSVED